MFISTPQIQMFFLAFVRVLAILSAIPVLGGNAIPIQVRIGFGMLVTILLVPWNNVPASEEIPLFSFAFSMGEEFFIGIIAGFAATITFAAFQLTGELIGYNSGFNSGRILNPAMGESSSTLDQFFLMISLLFFLVINGHHTFLLAVQRTFTLVPINTSIPELSIDQIIHMFADLITAGVQLALPGLGALVMTDISLSLLARITPRVQVFFIGLPFKIAVGLLAVTISLNLYYPVITEMLEKMGARMLSLLGA